MLPRSFQRCLTPGVHALVIEDDDFTRQLVTRRLEEHGAHVRAVATIAAGLQAFNFRPELIILDVQLPDGTGDRIVEAALDLRPIPRMIVMTGAATREQTFQLARLHVQQYLEKPFDLETLDAVLVRQPQVERDLFVVSALAVGHVGLVQARAIVRESMTRQALKTADGNRTQAAETLGVTRQAIQHAARDLVR